jgi:F-type H+-transporting ATPase subunit delta
VTVARPLSQEQKERLQKALERQLGRQVNLHVVVDPSVVGGARVQVGDEVIEGTVAGRLAAAEKQLTQ